MGIEKGSFMPDKQTTKRSVTLHVDVALVERIENTIQHVPPGWDMTRVFEVGAVELLERLERGEFDLVAVGRSLIANPSWPTQVRNGGVSGLRPFNRSELGRLV